MSQENVMKFFKAIETDMDLQEKIAAQLKKDKPADEETVMEKIVEIASENGLIFSVDDIKSAAKKNNDYELNDEQLEKVAGGEMWSALF